MRSRAAGVLAFALLCACEAKDQVLTPDETDSGRGAATLGDASQPMVVDAAGPGVVPVIVDAAQPLDASTGAVQVDAMVASDTGSSPADATATVPDAAPSADSGPVTHTAKDPDCDLNGVWIARQITVSIALALEQFANNWYYLEFTQDGEDVVVTKHMDCGCVVRGALDLVRVEIPVATTRALIAHNSQVGRKGRFSKQADGTCALQIDKFWSVRGAKEETYVPTPRNSDVTIQQLQAEKPLPTRAMVSATEDWDGDGQPGIAWVVMGVASGTRHSIQRDWTRWFSASGHQVTAAMDFGDLRVRAEFANEEVVMAESSASLRELSQADGSAQHSMTMRFLGRTRDDMRARGVIKADDFDTCMAIQAALPPLLGLR
jgi:hypothetical protein